MFQSRSFSWKNPQEKTLVLTYDDGPGQTPGDDDSPGPRTRELAQYLNSMGIRATFFVIGIHAESHLDILKDLCELGHLIANHTYSHPATPPPRWESEEADHFCEIKRTHDIVKPYVKGKLFFRAPGDDPWPKKKPGLLDQLNADPELKWYIGPISWNIDPADYELWESRSPDKVEDAVKRIRNKIIIEKKSGIVLLHDCSTKYELKMREGNQALAVAKLLIPELLDAGYRFKRLDEVM